MVIDITIKYYDVQYGRNFAGRLAHFLFRNEEKIASNYRGVLNKRLDVRKTEAIKHCRIPP